MGIAAKVIEDSITPWGDRLTTIEATFHRFVLAEFNTHRSHSRNSASSRAIPVTKQLAKLVNDPAIPVVWTTEQAGMQGGEPLTGYQAERAEMEWMAARDHAIDHARNLIELGVHKSITNRLLEPFMFHTVIASATDRGWDNFFDQRCSTLAQPEIHAVADLMCEAYEMSQPKILGVGQWHLPYLSDEDRENLHLEEQKMVSSARCARVSYLTHDGVRDFSKDFELFQRLVSATPAHASPLEHVATPVLGAPGNFDGFKQLRHLAVVDAFSQPSPGELAQNPTKE